MAEDTKSSPKKALEFSMKSLAGEEVALDKYQGKVVLVVNVASECGLTPQYAELQALYEKYQDKGLVVLGFPCNQFGGQEPGNSKAISQFCTKEYGVTFDMFEKVEVNGEGACGLYEYLTSLELKPKSKGKIAWNFEKFLLARDGSVAARYSPQTTPDDKSLVAEIESLLGSK